MAADALPLPALQQWLGAASARLPQTAGLSAALTAAVSATDGPTREQSCHAYETVAARHNQLGLTPPLDTRTRRFYDRPCQVIDAARFTAALREEVTDPQIRHLPTISAIDQFTDSTDAIGNLPFRRTVIKAAMQPPDCSADEE